MTADEIDLVEEILGPAIANEWVPPAAVNPAPQPSGWDTIPFGGADQYVGSGSGPSVRRERTVHNPFAGLGRLGRIRIRRVPLSRSHVAVAFVVGAIATAILMGAAAAAVFDSYSGKVLPGVKVGSVDISGMTRDQVMALVKTQYHDLERGQATVTTPNGIATVTYSQAGRAPDAEAMADEAMAVGRSGNPILDTVAMVRTAAAGRELPVVVRVDPGAIATRLRQLVGTSDIPARDAKVTVEGTSFVPWMSTDGVGIDETALAGSLIDQLTQSNAPDDIRISGGTVILEPDITSQDADAAIVAAGRMIADTKLSWTATTSSDAGQASIAAGTSTLSADTIRGLIVFGTLMDGSYGPSIDPTKLRTVLTTMFHKVGTPAVEPSVVYDSSGKPSALSGGKSGMGIEIDGASRDIEKYLGDVARGGFPSEVLLPTAPVAPQLTLSSLTGMVIIGEGQGKWTTTFYPDISNGNGANIRTPAKLLNGQVVAPGQQFSFLAAVSPIDLSHGYAMGGVIVHGKSDHTGAIGGGICSASTTMFNAAARAGREIDERHAHSYYITRYPVGLDATVFESGGETMDLKWTNDTSNPIVIRARTTKGSKSTITVELWSLPLDRIATFSPEYKANVIKATDHAQYTTTLAVGQKNRAEYPTDGFDTSRTRTVTDSAGDVIHKDTWTSHYIKVDGLLQIGVAAKKSSASGTPAPSPADADTAAIVETRTRLDP